MPRAAVLLGLIVVWAAMPAVAAVVSDERPIAPGQVVNLRIDAGAVSVRPGEAGKAVVQADLLPGQRLVWRQALDRLVLVVDDSDRLSPRPADVALRVPPDTDLRLQLGDASLDLDGVGGERLVVRGGRGDLRVRAAARRVDIESSAGAIDAEVPEVGLRVSSVQGDLRLASGGGPVDASTVSGAIDARLATGAPVRLASVSGAVTLRVASTVGLDARLESLSGPLRVRTRAGDALSVAIQQASGSVRLTPAFLPAAEGRWRSGEGAAAATFRTFSGPVEVQVDPPGGDAP